MMSWPTSLSCWKSGSNHQQNEERLPCAWRRAFPAAIAVAVGGLLFTPPPGKKAGKNFLTPF
jgi:hypothetical protein